MTDIYEIKLSVYLKVDSLDSAENYASRILNCIPDCIPEDSDMLDDMVINSVRLEQTNAHGNPYFKRNDA